MPRRLEDQTFTVKQILAAGIVLLGFIVGGLQQWYELKERVSALEREMKYLHGDVRIPGAK